MASLLAKLDDKLSPSKQKLVVSIGSLLLSWVFGHYGLSTTSAIVLALGTTLFHTLRKTSFEEAVKQHLVSTLTGWSDDEGAEWFNGSFVKYWNAYKRELNDKVHDTMQNILAGYSGWAGLEEIVVKEVDVGPTAPKLKNFKFLHTGGKFILLETTLYYEGRIYVGLEVRFQKLPNMSATAAITKLEGKVRFKMDMPKSLGELSSQPVWMSLRKKPTIAFELVVAGQKNLFDWDALKSKIEGSIQGAIYRKMVWPNNYQIKGQWVEGGEAESEKRHFKGKVMVKVLRALNLENRDEGGGDVSDPYCVATVNGVQKRTRVVKDNLNPVWFDKEKDEPWDWPLDSRDRDGILRVEAFDEDKLTRDESLGAAEIDLFELPYDRWEERWLTLAGKDVRRGTILVEVKLIRDAEKEKEAKERELKKGAVAADALMQRRKVLGSGYAIVEVLRAKDLPNVETHKDQGKSDPYLTLRLGNLRQKTDILEETLEPEWNEKFVFKIDGERILEGEVKDFQKFGKNRSMGRFMIDLNEIKEEMDHDPKWYNLRGGRGSVQLALKTTLRPRKDELEKALSKSSATIAYSMTAGGRNMAGMMSMRGGPGASSKVNRSLGMSLMGTMGAGPAPIAEGDEILPVKRVSVTIHCCEGLKNVEKFGKSDPLVRVSLGAKEFKTEAKRNELNPVYEKTFDWDWKFLAPEEGQTQRLPDLVLKVEDDELMGTNRPLGEYTLSLQHIGERNDAVKFTEELEHGEGGTITFSVELIDNIAH
eukprot:tig00020557_g11120.t1